MVVVLIIGMLATLVAPAVLGQSAEAALQKAKTDIKGIEDGITRFILQNRGQVPTMEDLLTEDEHGEPWINGGDFNEDGEMVDPWNNPYQLEQLAARKFDVYSLGPDGEEDSEDDIHSARNR